MVSSWEEIFSAEIKCRNRITQYHKQIGCVFFVREYHWKQLWSPPGKRFFLQLSNAGIGSHDIINKLDVCFLYENVIRSSYGLLPGGDLEVGKTEAFFVKRVTNNAIRSIIQV